MSRSHALGQRRQQQQACSSTSLGWRRRQSSASSSFTATVSSRSSSCLHICSVPGERRDIEIPLLDVILDGAAADDDNGNELLNRYVQPLPSTHLPDEMTTLNVYGMDVAVPLHQSIVEYAVEHAKEWVHGDGLERTFGHLAYKPNNDSLVGAIGCAAEVLLPPGMLQEISPSSGISPESSSSSASSRNVLFEDGKSRPILCRGMYRFIVKEIKQEFPFPVAIVDELADDKIETLPQSTTTDADKNSVDEYDEAEDDDEEEDDDDDMYADLTHPQLVQRTMLALNSYVNQQLELTLQDMSPLEKSIIEQSGLPDLSSQRQAAEETAAVWDVFQQYLVDLCPGPTERAFAIGFMAAEMANLSNDVRRAILTTTSSVERLRIVLKSLEDTVGMAQARKMANAISKEAEGVGDDGGGDGTQELQVGQPSLPPWASAIRQGMRVEYFWNEEYDWCAGTVVGDPQWIVNEYIITIEFDDGEVHKLPFSADEKVRWRPERPSSLQ